MSGFNIEEAKENAVMLRLSAFGTPVEVYNYYPFIGWFSNGYNVGGLNHESFGNEYYYIYEPGTGIKLQPYTGTSKLTEENGEITNFSLTANEIKDGTFAWNHQDISMGYMDNMEHRRYYSSNPFDGGNMGVNWDTSFNYKLDLQTLYGNFHIPGEAGVPFVYNRNLNGYYSLIGDDYKLSFTGVDGTEYPAVLAEDLIDNEAKGKSSLKDLPPANTGKFYKVKADVLYDYSNLQSYIDKVKKEQEEAIIKENTSGAAIISEENKDILKKDKEEITSSAALKIDKASEITMFFEYVKEEKSKRSIEAYEPITTITNVEILQEYEAKIEYDEETNTENIYPVLEETRALVPVVPYGSEYVISYKDEDFYYFNEDKKITKVEKNGVTYEFQHTGGKITKVTNSFNMELNYFYYNDLLVKVVDGLGKTVTYGYDENNNLTTVNYQDGGQVNYTYENLDGRRLTSISDRMGNVYGNINYNDKNKVTSIKLKDKEEERFSYNDTERVVKHEDINNKLTSYYYYNSDNYLEKIFSESENITYLYDEDYKLVQEVNTLGEVKEYTYNYKDMLVKITYSDGTSYEKVYDNNDRLKEERKRDGSVIKYTFDENEMISDIIDGRGNVESYEYNDNKLLTSYIDKQGVNYTYSYNQYGFTNSLVGDNGVSITTEYDIYGNLIKEVTQEGVTKEYTYDSNDKIIKIKENDYERTITRDKNGNVISETNFAGYVRTNEYDSNRLVKVTDFEGGTNLYDYNEYGQVTKQVNELGDSMVTTYDDNGNVVSVKNYNGTVYNYEYDNFNRVIKQKENDIEMTYVYDNINHTVTMKTDTKEVKTKTDTENRIIKEIDPYKNTITNEYDKNGNLIKTVDRLGNITTRSYDENDQLIKETLPNGNYVENVYDIKGNLIEVKLNGEIEGKYAYDNDGRLIKEIDAMGMATEYTHNIYNQIEKIKYPNGLIESYKYDLSGNIVEKRDNAGSLIKYTYNKANYVTSVTNSLGFTESYKLNKGNQVVEKTDFNGNITKYNYDKNGNLLEEKTEEDTRPQVIYLYDSMNEVKRKRYLENGEYKTVEYSYTLLSQLLNMEEDIGKTSFEYNHLGKIKKVVDTEGRETVYGYDSLGRETSIKYPSGEEIKYKLDESNNLLEVENGSLITKYEYDKWGNVLEERLPNGEVTTKSYNKFDKVERKEEYKGNGDIRYSYRYSYDEIGNLEKEIKTDIKGKIETKEYGYDLSDNLINYKEVTARETKKVSYRYDARGNIVLELINIDNEEKAIRYEYNIDNQLIEKVSEGKETKYKYDSVGNLIEEEGADYKNNYEYNGESRLIKGSNEKGEETEYKYNGLGGRVERSQKLINVNKRYENSDLTGLNPKYSEESEIKEEIKEESSTTISNNKIERQKEQEEKVVSYIIDYTKEDLREIESIEEAFTISYVYGNRRIYSSAKVEEQEGLESRIGEKRGTVYYHQDQLGSTTYTSNEEGEVVTYTKYDPWGNLESEYKEDINLSGIEASDDYTGHSYDKVINKYFVQFKMYDSEAKRFISKDTNGFIKIDEIKTINKYIYANNNPVRYVDY